MANKDVILITGANAGMGKATALELAKTGAKVAMLCRDENRGTAALNDVKSSSGNPEIKLFICDLADQESIRRFTGEFMKQYDRLTVLINNAGVILPNRHVTKEGYEMQFGVNHLGHFLLTLLLLEFLKKSAPAHIINVSSGMHKIGKIWFNDINLTDNYRTFRAYAQSKLCNILFTYELARRLEGTQVTVNALHPGAVATQMGINRETGFGTVITGMLKPFFLPPEKGAETAVYLAESPEVKEISGKYFYKKKIVSSSKLSYNKDTARRLWELSLKMTGLENV